MDNGWIRNYCSNSSPCNTRTEHEKILNVGNFLSHIGKPRELGRAYIIFISLIGNMVASLDSSSRVWLCRSSGHPLVGQLGSAWPARCIVTCTVWCRGPILLLRLTLTWPDSSLTCQGDPSPFNQVTDLVIAWTYSHGWVPSKTESNGATSPNPFCYGIRKWGSINYQNPIHNSKKRTEEFLFQSEAKNPISVAEKPHFPTEKGQF